MLPSITMHVLPGPRSTLVVGAPPPQQQHRRRQWKRRRLGRSLPNLRLLGSVPAAAMTAPVRVNRHMCPVCQRPFQRASARDVHQRILHPWSCRPDGTLEDDPGAIEMPFGCDKCDKRFPTRAMYFLHRRLHTGRMTQKCLGCGKKVFVRRTKLRHMRVPTLHVHVAPFDCTCGKSFESEGAVDLHVARRTKGQVVRKLRCVCGSELKQQVLIKPTGDVREAALEHLNLAGKMWAGIAF